MWLIFEHIFQIIDDDGCEYITGLEFPNYKPPKRGQNIIIHGVENLTIYASIDHNAKADPVPEDDPAENEDEDDIWGTLPSRRGSLNDDDD